ncbi:DNA processing protein DprA [Cellulomonas cellasea]|uniref:DNA processing protein DprA n=1 Tax=Cellulomonas cellasea TaxID=43670 RepID=A0A4Y3KY28_9CELL|nr:DNA processing protein DprA [Cellulomonas cellasea]
MTGGRAGGAHEARARVADRGSAAGETATAAAGDRRREVDETLARAADRGNEVDETPARAGDRGNEADEVPAAAGDRGSEVDETLARAAWSRLVEPGDTVAGALVHTLGAREALDWVRWAAAPGRAEAAVETLVAREDESLAPLRRRLRSALARWEPRLAGLEPGREIDHVHRLGGRFLRPGAPGWPLGLDDLGAAAPLGLWQRGVPDLGSLLTRSVALVGARASTAYGERVAVELAEGLAARGVCVVSGGAYGIDAAAHRGALAGGGVTVALLAGGVDRAYPAGNAELLERLLDGGGAVLSEVPPGGVPSRSRFLMRNRLIAAVSRATVVVEAAWRSGALSTAHHAASLLRPLGAVPGPVTSVASAGCHRLLREGAAVCVTDAAEVLELVGPLGAPPDERPEEARPHDGLDWVADRLLDALSLRSAATVDTLARRAGLSPADVRGALGTLELAGLAELRATGWRRTNPVT